LQLFGATPPSRKAKHSAAVRSDEELIERLTAVRGRPYRTVVTRYSWAALAEQRTQRLAAAL
jgi:3-methyladenine DNA glycosylase/8-oxoguanine DNA glycosylase